MYLPKTIVIIARPPTAPSPPVTSGGNEELVLDVKRDFEGAAISDKLKALLAIASKVQRGGKSVLPEDVERARRQGAADHEIHDTVLIAAAFRMYNRYVDGLATWAPSDPAAFRERAAKVAREGCPRWLSSRVPATRTVL